MIKVILYIATSLDGFIADKDGGVDWLPHPNDEQDIFGMQDLMKRISTIVMGNRSYQQILTFGDWAWGDKQTYVFSSEELSTDRSDIHFVQDDPAIFIDKLKSQDPNQQIWLLGGAELIKSFSASKLIDECIITIIPMNLDEGIKLELPYEDFILENTKECMDGIIQKKYIGKLE